MRIGLSLPHYRALGHRDAVIPIIDAAESLGFSSVWTTDHIVVTPGAPGEYEHLLESFITLAVAAGRTEHVELGTSVIVIPQREPFLLAKQAATIHHLSGGRLILGVGVGWLEEEFALLGADFANRGAVTDEAIDALRAIWASPNPHHEGQHIHFDNAVTSPVDLDLRPIPVLVGGGSRAALRRAARHGDGWHAIRESVESLRLKLDELHRLSTRPLQISLRGSIAPARTIPDPETASTSLWGSKDQIIDRLFAYAELGVEHVIVDPHTSDQGRFLTDMEWIASEILPEALGMRPAPWTAGDEQMER